MSTAVIAGILDSSRELDRLKKEQEDVIIEINKMHKKLQATLEVVEKPGDTSLSKLRNLYVQAKELLENEMTVANALISQIDALTPSGLSGSAKRRLDGINDRKRKLKNDSEMPRLSPPMRSQFEACASLKGEQVAARVTNDDSEQDEWFIGKVMHFDRETKQFDVLDEEDDEEGGGQRKYKLPISHIKPFPKQNDPSSAPEFLPGTHVLAVYPETTALYKATVLKKRKADEQVAYDDFLKQNSKYRIFIVSGDDVLIGALCLFFRAVNVLEFDDDEEDGEVPQRTVPFHKVVPLPEGYRQ